MPFSGEHAKAVGYYTLLASERYLVVMPYLEKLSEGLFHSLRKLPSLLAEKPYAKTTCNEMVLTNVQRGKVKLVKKTFSVSSADLESLGTEITLQPIESFIDLIGQKIKELSLHCCAIVQSQKVTAQEPFELSGELGHIKAQLHLLTYHPDRLPGAKLSALVDSFGDVEYRVAETVRLVQIMQRREVHESMKVPPAMSLEEEFAVLKMKYPVLRGIKVVDNNSIRIGEYGQLITC